MKPLFHASVVYALCACVAGCAGPGKSSLTAGTATPISALSARDAITIGKSTRADVSAALGKTTAVGFDSGFEVWVYRIEDDTPDKASRLERIGKTEFVLLFSPAGVVTKTRIRPPPPPGGAKGS